MTARGSQSALFILSKKVSVRGSPKISRRRNACTLWRAPNCLTLGKGPVSVATPPPVPTGRGLGGLRWYVCVSVCVVSVHVWPGQAQPVSAWHQRAQSCLRGLAGPVPSGCVCVCVSVSVWFGGPSPVCVWPQWAQSVSAWPRGAQSRVCVASGGTVPCLCVCVASVAQPVSAWPRTLAAAPRARPAVCGRAALPHASCRWGAESLGDSSRVIRGPLRRGTWT